MKLGNKIFFLLLFYFTLSNNSLGEEKITSTPLINVEKIKPSFEELVEDGENNISNNLKEKKMLQTLNRPKQF